jgi:hypothetical protein
MKTLLENVTELIGSKRAETKIAYNGNDERIVIALEKVLKLTQ